MLWLAVLSIITPWAIVMAMLIASEQRTGYAWGAWLVVGVSVLWALWFDSGAEQAVIDVVEESGRRSGAAFVHILRYIVPFTVYPIMIYFMKTVSDASSQIQHTKSEQTDTTNSAEENNRRVSQTRVISWVVKILIMVFVLISLLTELGIETSDVLQITSIFSLGLSWSMRDWLSGLWACSMMAFTTDLAPGQTIRVGFGVDGDELTVNEVALSFVICSRKNNRHVKTIYIPNNVMFNQGFTIL